ncbi:MAG: V-type ATP synthase subunit E [Oscillospiraceae bacterium]|nr:V-type ATP synthase subunit E [Oscillospiraceae bacterium]
MSEKNEKLRKFIEAVNSEAEARASEILTEAEQEKKRIISAAEEKGRREAELYLDDKKSNAGRDFVREVSRAELEMKREVLLHRDELTNQLFAAVEKRVAEYRKTPAYAEKLKEMLTAAQVDGDAEIMLAPEDMKYADSLKKALKTDKAVFKEDQNIRLGGMAVYFKEKGVVIDSTFDHALEDQRSEFISGNAFAAQ